jgi:hypothetical protein
MVEFSWFVVVSVLYRNVCGTLPGDVPIIEASNMYVGVLSSMVCSSPHMHTAQKAARPA